MKADLSAKRAAELQRMLSKHERKIKASVSLSGELIRAADAVAGKAQRSALVERAVRRYLLAILRRARREHDLRVIAARADLINRGSDGLLDIQAWPG
jgi:metal-responsive CopG/Arc/MetJ family transcriptional regulator